MSALPAQIGRYRVISKLGTGGMADVFLGMLDGPMGFQKSVVIKRIRAEHSSDDGYRQMFVQEARVTSALSHSHIVSLLDFGESDGLLHLVLEHVDGLDLSNVLAAVKTLDAPTAVFIAVCVLRGLAYAHRRRDARGEPLGIVHRDLSPANILLGRNGDVKIADFGIAKAEGAARTAPGTLKGKLSYMSPEQAAGAPVDARSDLFSTALVLLEMLTGAAAYPQKSNVELLVAVREAAISVPASLGRVAEPLRRALAKNPAQRFADADVMADALMATTQVAGPTAVEMLIDRAAEPLEPSRRKTLVPPSPWSQILKGAI